MRLPAPTHPGRCALRTPSRKIDAFHYPDRVRKIGWLAFAGYFLLAAAWALALPPNGTYDERQHVVKAYAIWDGQLLPHHTATDGASRGLSGASIGPDCQKRPCASRR